ncbi:MAG TPA: ABC transporter substrate-binding protein [Archaeoglobus profundus]|nr:ABC transporter substrate-binding protein [Archaeoglobus profundus]
MVRWLSLVALLLSLLLLGSAKGLTVIVTFPNLEEDIKLIAPGDVIRSIVPVGVDPHTYQLTPADIENLKKADVIISTAHTHFEMKIKKMVENGEIKAKLIEIPNIPGIKILNNPITHNPNYHMPIYDPENYKVFIKYVSEVLYNITGDKSYKDRAKKVIDEVNEIMRNTKKLNVTAVADLPYTQYAVSWLNVDIKYLVMKEHGISPTPQDLQAIENAIKAGEIKLAVITKDGPKVSEILLDLAKKYEIDVLYVPSPISMKSIPDKLKDIHLEKPSHQAPLEFPIIIIALLIAYVWNKRSD